MQGYRLISSDYTHPYKSNPNTPTFLKQLSTSLRRRQNRSDDRDNEDIAMSPRREDEDGVEKGLGFNPIVNTRSRVSIRELGALGAAAVDDIRSFPRHPITPSSNISGDVNQDGMEKGDYVSIHDDTAMTRLQALRSFLSSLLTPPTIALLAALVIALTPKLKALFYYDAMGSFNPRAPDGLPVLGVILDGAYVIRSLLNRYHERLTLF